MPTVEADGRTITTATHPSTPASQASTSQWRLPPNIQNLAQSNALNNVTGPARNEYVPLPTGDPRSIPGTSNDGNVDSHTLSRVHHTRHFTDDRSATLGGLPRAIELAHGGQMGRHRQHHLFVNTRDGIHEPGGGMLVKSISPRNASAPSELLLVRHHRDSSRTRHMLTTQPPAARSSSVTTTHPSVTGVTSSNGDMHHQQHLQPLLHSNSVDVPRLHRTTRTRATVQMVETREPLSRSFRSAIPHLRKRASKPPPPSREELSRRRNSAPDNQFSVITSQPLSTLSSSSLANGGKMGVTSTGISSNHLSQQSIICPRCNGCRCEACRNPRRAHCYRGCCGDSFSQSSPDSLNCITSTSAVSSQVTLASSRVVPPFNSSIVQQPVRSRSSQMRHPTTRLEANLSTSRSSSPNVPDGVVDMLSCLCCVKATHYHCTGESIQTDELCSCEPPGCCKRWTLLGLLACCLPCLWCYWPLRGVASLGEECSAHARRRDGCRCSYSDLRPVNSNSSSFRRNTNHLAANTKSHTSASKTGDFDLVDDAFDTFRSASRRNC